MFCVSVHLEWHLTDMWVVIWLKADEVVQFHTGEIITSLRRCRLITGGDETLVYSTGNGSSVFLFCPLRAGGGRISIIYRISCSSILSLSVCMLLFFVFVCLLCVYKYVCLFPLWPVFGAVMGGLGCFTPLPTTEDVEFFQTLEMHLRTEAPPLCGREHMMFRSSYFPVQVCVCLFGCCVLFYGTRSSPHLPAQAAIDGDLCEQFSTLEPSKQRSIAEEMERVPSEVTKKLEDFRNKIL